MPPSISPWNQTAERTLDQSEEDKPPWEKFLNALDEKRPIKRLVKHDEAVILSREYNKQRKNAVWTKIYQPIKDLDLSVFNEWECELITRAHNLSVKGCYKPAELIITGTHLQHTGDTPANLRRGRKTIIKTIHGGPELNHWQSMNLCVNQKPVPHPFVAPANFLRLAQGILKALYHFHNEGFFHCDLNPGNLVLPALAEGQNSVNKKIALNSRNLEKIKITLQWDKIILIDLGFSLSRNNKPYTTLPLDTKSPRMSVHLRGRLNDIESQAIERLTHLGSQQSWGEVCYDKKFWNKWADSPLKLLQEFDWREDLYQLGYLLKDIRNSWGGGEHVTLSNPALSKLIYSLPERLLEWGDPSQLDQPAPEEMPHLKMISETEYALTQAEDKDRQDTFYLYRQDNDPNYAERRQHWLRRWRNAKALRDKLTGVSHQTWTNFFNLHPLLILLIFSYPALVVLAPMGLTLYVSAALTIGGVLGLAVWKLKGLMVRGAALSVMSLAGLLRYLADELSVGWKRCWRNVIAYRDKLTGLLQNAWTNFFNLHPLHILLIFSYPTFALIAIIIGKDPIGLPLVGTFTLFTLIVLVSSIVDVVEFIKNVLMAITSLSPRISQSLRIFTSSRYLYPVLLIPLVWGAEAQYNLSTKAENLYEDWQEARNYAESVQKIQQSRWWQGERTANTQESAWLNNTHKLAGHGLPQAMFMTALTRCYGMQSGGVVVLQSDSNLAECGPLLSIALQKGAQRWHVQSNSSGWFAMLEDTVGVLDSTLYYKSPPPGSVSLAQALTPGLEAAAPYSAKLAYTLADIQACWLKPSQNNSARQTLQALIENFPDSEFAKRAKEHLPGLTQFCS